MVALASSSTTKDADYVPLLWKIIAIVSALIAAMPIALSLTLFIYAFANVTIIFAIDESSSLSSAKVSTTLMTDIFCCTVGASFGVWNTRSFLGMVVFGFLMLGIQAVSHLLTGRYLEMFRMSSSDGGDNVLLLLYPPCSRPRDCPPVLWK